MTDIGETLIDYRLKEDLEDAERAGVFVDMSVPGENEDRHVSELGRRMKALDEKETYITVRALVMNHWETFSKSIQYLKNKEGEKYGTNQSI